MKHAYTFHKTVIGHLHELRGIPCEDSSTSLVDESGRCHIVAIADGHGAAECFRSNIGSKFAVEVACMQLSKWAEAILESSDIENKFYNNILSDSRYRKMNIRRITDSILAAWNDTILIHYTENPPTEEELGEYVKKYQNGQMISHIYGTTLIAAVLFPACLILLQQGDGRCDVFYSDGTVEQPIPWDLRCEDNVTTSLCDIDAAESFRSCVINLYKREVVACYLGCDGVEDAYRDTYEDLGNMHRKMGGVHTFYKSLTCKLVEMSTNEFEQYLESFFSEFSANGLFSQTGSGDDISVAGIVDLEKLPLIAKQFEMDIKRYDLEEKIFCKEDELRSKIRKHDILQKRMNETLSEVSTLQLRKDALKIQLDSLYKEREKCVRLLEQEKKNLEFYKKNSDDVKKGKSEENALVKNNNTLVKLTISSDAIQQFNKKIFEFVTNEINIRNKSVIKLQKQIDVLNSQIQELETENRMLLKNLQDFQTRAKEAKNIYDDYHHKYQEIYSELQKLKNMLNLLSNKISE